MPPDIHAVVLKPKVAWASENKLKQSTSGTFLLSATLLFVVFFSGFINLIPTGSLFPATVIIDGIYLLMFAGYAVAATTRDGVRVDPWVLMFILLLATYLCLFANGSESLYDKYLTLRNQVLYIFVAIFVSANIKSRPEAIRLLRLAMRLSVVLAAFGILQFVFRASLPEWLLVSRDTTIFGYYGTDITRSTGLVGNTIVYSNLLLLFFALHVAKVARRFRIWDLVSTLILFSGILLSFSRVAIVGSVIIALVLTTVVIVKRNPSRTVVLGSGALLLGGVGLALIFLSDRLTAQMTSSFIYRDLFLAQNASVQSSTDLHNVYIDIALETLQDNPWCGFGIASQNQNSINAESSVVITDGALWSLLAEGGLALFLSYSVFLIACGITAFKTLRTAGTDRYVAAAFLIFSAYEFFVSAVYNSAFFGKAPFILYWLVFGIVVAVGRTSHPSADINP